ncbi:uncharacterized protein LOC121396054 [Xenopus laevis]|uniref:Uncharacterized protein LOC121396054 n=1 Tax=Xenopus laevis TaxID=8355 RepID=A0A8J1LAM8_XENLA|nr:uncharacterized protein LOC121396054 [Xenopus laevis]
MRQFLIGAFIICALTATVCSIKCMSCNNYYLSSFQNCTGPTVECDRKYDSCGTSYFLKLELYEKKQHTYETGCWQSEDCNKTLRMTALGLQLTRISSCCNTDNCTPPETFFEPQNSTKNGVLCLTGFTDEKSIVPKYAMACTGEETIGYIYWYITLVVILFFYLSCISVNSLVCPVCYSVIDSCVYRPVQCEGEENVCLTESIWTRSGNKNKLEFIRRCGKAAECSRVGTYRSNTKKFVINTTCCDSSMCHPPVPTLPNQTSAENGMACPTCFADNARQCILDDPLNCVGNENRCIRYLKEEFFENKLTIQSFSGCTTESICGSGSSTKKFLYLTKRNFKTVKMHVTCSGSGRLNIPFRFYPGFLLVGLRIIKFLL